MIFRKIEISNIRSFENCVVEFSEGTTLLSGDIGVGKTSILLALSFALFGLQPGQKGASILRNGVDNGGVRLEFEVDEKKIVVERGLKRAKGGGISQDYNKIIIDGNGEELSTSEMKNKIIRLLDYPKEFVKKSNLLYKFTVYTPQESMKEIVLERPEIRLDTLRHIFGIDRYRRIKENSGIFLQKIKENVKVREVLISELPGLREKIVERREKKVVCSRDVNDLSVKVTMLEEERKVAEEEFKDTEKRMDEKRIVEGEISRRKVELDGKKNMFSKVEKEIGAMGDQLKNKVEFNAERLKEVDALVNKHKENLNLLNENYLKANSAISVWNSKKENALGMKDKIVGLENCPTCFQTVGGEHKEKISKRVQYDLEDIDRELIPKIKEKERLVEDIEKEKELIGGYERDLMELKQDKIKFEHFKIIDTKMKSEVFVVDRLKNEINEIEKIISEKIIEMAKFADVEERFTICKSKIDAINAKFRTAEILLTERRKELEMVDVQIKELDEQISNKDKIKEGMNYLRSMQDWFENEFLSMISLTEKNVMANLRMKFSELFSEWFSYLVSQDLSIRLDEDFTPVILNQDYELDYDFLSGGERTAVALAYRLSLNQVLNSLLSKIKTKDILILDEPTDGFSAQQLDKMRDIFEELNARQTIIVSHEQKIEGFVDHIVKVGKDSGISNVAEVLKSKVVEGIKEEKS